MGIPSPTNKKQKEGQSDLPVLVVFQMPLTQNSQYTSSIFWGMNVINANMSFGSK